MVCEANQHATGYTRYATSVEKDLYLKVTAEKSVTLKRKSATPRFFKAFKRYLFLEQVFVSDYTLKKRTPHLIDYGIEVWINWMK